MSFFALFFCFSRFPYSVLGLVENLLSSFTAVCYRLNSKELLDFHVNKCTVMSMVSFVYEGVELLRAMCYVWYYMVR